MKNKPPKKVLFIITGIVLFFPLQVLVAGEYLWPIEGCQTLTGTFGEFRYNHIHAGIDISTGGITGLPLRAIDNGYIHRIRTSPFGYGRAIYLTLDDGNIAVYGHLSKFTGKIESWVRQKQLQSGEFSIDAYPKPHLFPIRKGEVIGYSGDTGNVPAHLHFELRKKKNRPVNPFNYLDALPSSQTPPRIIALAVNPIGIDSTVDETWETKIYQARWDERRETYYIPDDIYVWGTCGIEIFAYDQSRGYWMGLRKIQLFVNDRLVSTVQYDSFSFQEYRHNYRVVDRELYVKGKGRFQRLYQTSANHVSFYSMEEGTDGILTTLDPSPPNGLESGKNRLKVIVESHGRKNRSLLFQLVGQRSFFQREGNVILQPASFSALPLKDLKMKCKTRFFEDFLTIEMTTDVVPPVPPQCFIRQTEQREEKIEFFRRSPKDYIGRYRIIPYVDGISQARILFSSPTGERKETFHSFMVQTVSPEKGGTVVSDDRVVRITFRPDDVNALMFPRVEKVPVNSQPAFLEAQSLSYEFRPLDVTFNSPGEIVFRYSKALPSPHQCAIFYKDKGRNWRYLSSIHEPEKGTIHACVPFFASFALMRDPHPPVIHPYSPKSGTLVSSDNVYFSVRINDKGSGINYKETYMKVDGDKVPAEYVPKKGLLFFNSPKPLGAGSHCMEIIASDLVGNTSKAEVTFKVQTI